MQNFIIESVKTLNKDNIIKILQLRGNEQSLLFDIARQERSNGKCMDNVELRSVIELSNICVQKCNYCSIAKEKKMIYTLGNEIILKRIGYLYNIGRRTFLLQSGENHNQKFIDDIANCCRQVKKLYPDVRLILCMGNLSNEQYMLLKESGADRYILKFETSNKKHHMFCRPSDTIENRLTHIENLIKMGYQVGSGNIVGLPEQTLDNLYEDLVLINNLDLAMISSTRFISNPYSVFKEYPDGDIDLTLNFIAIMRILKPHALIPSTTSLSINKDGGQIKGLMAGCNTVTIHDGTPSEFKKNYSIYTQERFSPQEEFCRNIINQCNLKPVPYLL